MSHITKKVLLITPSLIKHSKVMHTPGLSCKEVLKLRPKKIILGIPLIRTVQQSSVAQNNLEYLTIINLLINHLIWWLLVT